MINQYQNLTPFLPFNPLNHTQLWLAVAKINQQQVIIKQLLQGYTQTQFDNFYQEYQIYEQINNLGKNKKCYFAERLDGKIGTYDNWLALPWYQGQNLKQIMAENPRSFSQKIDYFIQLCQAIGVLHSLGFVHCDIKPSNIFITNEQVKLLDFGLAKPTKFSQNQKNSTAGTPAYMSPEQFHGAKIAETTDFYSLGVVMYELFAETKPFYADNLHDWAVLHCQSPVPAMTAVNGYQMQGLQPIIHQLLAKYPQNRPQDLTQICAQLKNLVES